VKMNLVGLVCNMTTMCYKVCGLCNVKLHDGGGGVVFCM
jgi:hypothetical protein